MTKTINADALPDWAEHTGDNGRGMPVIEVDTHEAYPDLLAEYQELYSEGNILPGEWKTKEGELRAEFKEMLEDLERDVDEVTAYWLEVLFQTAKLDVIRAVGFGTENRFHDQGKRFAQSAREEGRGADKAAGGVSGGREAREHYKRLRGFLPA